MQLTRDPDLTEEALARDSLAPLGLQDLDRNRLGRRRTRGKEDRSVGAVADFPFDPVAWSERGTYSLEIAVVFQAVLWTSRGTAIASDAVETYVTRSGSPDGVCRGPLTVAQRQKVPADRFTTAKEFSEALLNPSSSTTHRTVRAASSPHAHVTG